MADSFVIGYLSSGEAPKISRGISIIEGKLSESDQFQPEDAVQIFPLLIPLLMHIHYKVRKNSFYLFLSILNRYSDYLDSTSDSVPNCIASLICVDEEIAECAHQALEFIFDLDDPKYWWPYCEKVLFNSKSTPQRIKLMFIIYSHFDEIPVIPIIKLLDDPIFTIQKMAYSMLQFNDQDMIQTKLEKYRTLLGMDNNPYELDMNQRQLERYRQMQETIKAQKAQKTPAQVVRRTRRSRVSDNLLETRRQAAEETIQDEMIIQGEKAMQSANNNKVHSRFVTKIDNSSPIGKHTKGSYTSYDNYHLSPNLTLDPQLNIDPNPTLIQNPNNNIYPNEMDDQDYNYDPYYGSNQQNFNNTSNNRRNNQQFQSPNRNSYDNNFNNYDNNNARSRNSFSGNNQNQNRSQQQADRSYTSPGQSRRINSSSPSRDNQDRRYPAPVPNNSQQRNSNNFNNSYGNNSNSNSLFNRSNNNNNNLFNRTNSSNANNNGFSNRSNNNNFGNNSNNNGLFNRSGSNQNNNGSSNRFGNNSNDNRSYNANSNNDGLFNRSSNNNNNNNANSNGLFSRSSNNRSNSPNNMSNRYNDNQNFRNSASNMNNGFNNNQSNRSNNMSNRFNDNQSNRNNNMNMSNRFNDSQSNRSNSMNNRFNNDPNSQNNSNGLFNRSSTNRSNSPINMNNQNNRMNNSMNNRNSGNMNNKNNFMNNGFNNNQNYRNSGNMNSNNQNYRNSGNMNNSNQNYRNSGNMNNRFNDNQNNRGSNMNGMYNDNQNNRNGSMNANNQNYGNDNQNYDYYGENDAGSVTTESMFDQMYPTNQNSNALFDRDSLYEGIMQQLGNQGFDSNESQNRRSRKVSGNGDASQTIGNGSPSKSGDPLPFELVDLKDKNWEYRRDYLDMIHKTLSSKQKHYNYRHDYLMDCVMDASKPCNKRVAIALSRVITDIILEEPAVIEPFLDEITSFMVQSVSQFNSIYQVPSNQENYQKTTTKSSNVSAASSSVATPRASKSDTKASATSSALNSPRTKSKATTTPTPTKSGNASVTPKSNKATTKKSSKKSSKKQEEVEEQPEQEEIEEEEKSESTIEENASRKSATPSKNSRVFNIPTSPSKTARVVLVSKTPNSTKSTTKSKSGSQAGTKDNKASSSAKKKSLELSSNSRLFTASEHLYSSLDPSVFDDLIDAIILEVNPSRLINSMLDYPNRTVAHVELLIQKLYKRRPNLTLCRNDLERLLTFLVCDAYPLAYKLATIGNHTSQPAYLDAIIFILHKTSRNQPKIYASITSLQNHAGMVEILSKFLPEEEKAEIGDKSESVNTYNNYNTNNSLYNNNTNSRSTLRNTAANDQENDLNLPPMLIVLRELKKSDDCAIDLLADCFDNVDFNSLKHVMKLFLRFLALLSRLSEKKIQDNESDIRRICFSHFNYTDLLSILSLRNVEPEILIGLSKYVWFAPKEILNGADVYYENMYKLFAKSTGQERNAIIIVASCIQKATGKSILDLPSIADPHQKVIEKLLSQYENQNRE